MVEVRLQLLSGFAYTHRVQIHHSHLLARWLRAHHFEHAGTAYSRGRSKPCGTNTPDHSLSIHFRLKEIWGLVVSSYCISLQEFLGN